MIRFLFIVFGFIPLLGFTQTIPNSFKIINNRHPENEAFYITSIEKASMEKFRLKDKEVTLMFENGFDCVMIPAKQLFLKGVSINALNYEEKFAPLFSLPVFNVLQDGHLMATYSNDPKKSKK
jgi:hypothetical protein